MAEESICVLCQNWISSLTNSGTCDNCDAVFCPKCGHFCGICLMKLCENCSPMEAWKGNNCCKSCIVKVEEGKKGKAQAHDPLSTRGFETNNNNAMDNNSEIPHHINPLCAPLDRDATRTIQKGIITKLIIFALFLLLASYVFRAK